VLARAHFLGNRKPPLLGIAEGGIDIEDDAPEREIPVADDLSDLEFGSPVDLHNATTLHKLSRNVSRFEALTKAGHESRPDRKMQTAACTSPEKFQYDLNPNLPDTACLRPPIENRKPEPRHEPFRRGPFPPVHLQWPDSAQSHRHGAHDPLKIAGRHSGT